MSTINVIVIPANKDLPVRRESYDSTDYTNLTALIFAGDRDGTFDRMVSADPNDGEVTLWFDDNGLARLDHEDVNDVINLRAMQLYSHLEGVDLEDYAVPLIGDYVITGGCDEEGESLDAPAWIMDYPFSWHTRYTLQSRKETF
jgi:hypothetical protein